MRIEQRHDRQTAVFCSEQKQVTRRGCSNIGRYVFSPYFLAAYFSITTLPGEDPGKSGLLDVRADLKLSLE
jgi:hypothetical protein